MKQCNPELESLQQAVRDADKRALCSQEARVKAEAEAYRLEQERDELRTELLKRGQHGIFCTLHIRVGDEPFACNCGWEALKAKLAPPVHKGDS